jgi:hypothetical protein
MRQDNHSSNKGNQARPLDRAQTLAGQLARVHHADLRTTLEILTEFTGTHMQDASFVSPTGDTHSAAEELALTLLMVWRDRDVFHEVLRDYGHLLNMVRAFLVRQGGNTLATCQIDRIVKALAVDADAAVIADPAPARPNLRQLIRDKAIIAAAVCIALLLWDLTADHFPIWQLLCAIALIASVCPLMFRIGAKHGSIQTPVKAKP